jgi:spermidine/putrescine transport system substrate-binding protein
MKTKLLSTLLAATLLLVVTATGWAKDKELFVYIWSEYLPDEVVAEFTAATGIKVNVSTYDSNEAMYAKVKMVGQGYDLIVPSSDYVGLMSREGLLEAIDKSKLKNFGNLQAKFVNQSFDPGNKYSVPYMWGSTSIAVNTKIVGENTVKSMADLWKPELKGKLLLPNDTREVLGIGLKLLGYSINDKDPAHIKQAFEKMAALMPSVRVFDSDSPKQALLSGEVAVGVIWNGEAYVANSEDPAIHYIYPPEGFSLWMDSFCIPKGARNIDNALAFLDFILRPEIAAKISEEMGYSSPNAKAKDFLSDEIKKNPIVYPTPEDAARGEFLDNLGDATMAIYNNYWVKLKTD